MGANPSVPVPYCSREATAIRTSLEVEDFNAVGTALHQFLDQDWGVPLTPEQQIQALEWVQTLLRYGAEPNDVSSTGQTALDMAALLDCAEFPLQETTRSSGFIAAMVIVLLGKAIPIAIARESTAAFVFHFRDTKKN